DGSKQQREAIGETDPVAASTVVLIYLTAGRIVAVGHAHIAAQEPGEPGVGLLSGGGREDRGAPDSNPQHLGARLLRRRGNRQRRVTGGGHGDETGRDGGGTRGGVRSRCCDIPGSDP